MKRTFGAPIEVLWIEDSAADRKLIKDFFDWGTKRCHINFIADGEVALNHLFGETSGEPTEDPDLIVVDLNLPGRDGREVIARIKQCERTKRIPVIVFTSSSHEVDVASCYELQ